MLRIVEQKDANRSELAVQEVNTSVYVFEAAVLARSIAGLKSNNAQGEFYLTDALEMAKADGNVGAFAAPDPLTVEGVNDRVQLSELSKAYNRRICERWMRDGVTILIRRPPGSRTTCRSRATRPSCPVRSCRGAPSSAKGRSSAPTPR